MTSNGSNDQIIPEPPQVAPTSNIELHPHFLRAIEEQVAKQVAGLGLSTGGNMSDSNVSKDWIEQRVATSEARNDAKFERLLGDSNVKFEKLLGEMNTKFAQTETSIAKAEKDHTKWMIGIAISLFGTIIASTAFLIRSMPSYKDISEINEKFAVMDKNLNGIDSRIATLDVNLSDLKSDVAQINMSVKELAKTKSRNH